MAYKKMKTENYSLLGGINSKVSQYDNAPNEFRDITNLNFVNHGALTKRWGTTLYAGASVQGRITGGIEFERLSGASYLVFSANTNLYTVTPSGFNAINTGLLNGALFDFTIFVDRLFGANGQNFFKTDGVNVSNFSLPPGLTGAWGATATIGGSLTAGVTGIFLAAYGYENDRGYFGPTSNGFTVILNGVTFNSITYYGLTQPTGYGISLIALYRTSSGSVDLTGTTFAPSGTTTVLDTGFSLSTRLPDDNLWFTLAPRYLEIYNNQLFMAGFSSILSTAYWSQVGEPEAVDPTFFAEFRTNDGDRITGLKSYAGQLVVTKQRSFHRVSGDNPDNFLLQEVSDQYGCISNRAMVVFNNLLWFLDSKGIVEYNGANVEIVSNKMEPTFRTMNIDAAIDNALAIHHRENNEVWFAIPTNGATLNNTVVVYDYLANAWTKYEGLNLSHLMIARGVLGLKVPYYGGYTGNIFNFGSTYYGDNSQGITCYFKSNFLAQRGQSTENMYRRFYLNLNPIIGITQAITCNFYSNFGTTIQATRTMYQNPFQSRVDFGIGGRSIQIEMSHNSASLPLVINGFTFEGRFQRAV